MVTVPATTTILSPASAPTVSIPSPTPSTPGTPNPSTEVLNCFSTGTEIFQPNIDSMIPTFCQLFAGVHLSPIYQYVELEGPGSLANLDTTLSLIMSINLKNGCDFSLDESECNRIMHEIDGPRGCYDWSSSSSYTIGGWVDSNCATYSIYGVYYAAGKCFQTKYPEYCFLGQIGIT